MDLPLPKTVPQPRWRTLLILGRTSNVPTVWSNCLAGWLLGGGGPTLHFLLLCTGATMVYIGGMFLNDAFDAEFDRQHRPDRPIPSGAIAAGDVWTWSFILLLTGLLLLTLLGLTTAFLAILLLAAIVVYDAVHKMVAFAPALMAACRLLLLLVAASAAVQGVSGLAAWSALALAGYVVGLSYLARRETIHGPLRFWPLLFLGMPIALALFANSGGYLHAAWIFSLVLAGWIVLCLRSTFGPVERNIGYTVSGLLAGIVLVDWLSIAGGNFAAGGIFLLLFLLALVFQRFIPAT